MQHRSGSDPWAISIALATQSAITMANAFLDQARVFGIRPVQDAVLDQRLDQRNLFTSIWETWTPRARR
jgi:hypothetical protein